eukprot:12826983-Ditylum_brightwellii.AAC.1
MEKINEKLDVITKLIKTIPTMDNNNRGSRLTNNSWQPFKFNPHGYCWSCSYRVDKKNNSVTCLKKKDGHQDAVTRSNIMGGSQTGKQQQ